MSHKPITTEPPISILIERNLLPALSNAVRGAMPGVRMSKTVGLEDKGDWIELRLRLEPDELGPRADDQEAPASLAGLEVSDSNFGEFEASGGTFNG
jgi:hypothetical protein